MLAWAAGVSAAPAMAADAPPAKPGPDLSRLGQVTIDQYKDLIWEPEANHFLSPGPVRITLQDAQTGELTILTADDAEGSPTGEIVVHGKLQIARPEGTLTGRELKYDMQQRTGLVHDATATAAGLHVFGREIDIEPNGVLVARNASFTTCDKPSPDYHITARQIRVTSTGKVNARNVTFYLGRFRVISLPSMQKTFGHTVQNPIPLPGFSKENGVQIHFRNELAANATTSATYDIALAVKRAPEGSVSYEHALGRQDLSLAPPRTHLLTAQDPLMSPLDQNPALLAHPESISQDPRRTSLFALLSANTFVYNRRRTDLRVSRLPEIGLAARNILNRSLLPPGAEGAPPVQSLFGKGFFSPGLWLVNAELGAGYFRELPSRAEAGRFNARVDATSPLFLVTRQLYARYGGVVSTSAYTNGNAYTIAAPEAEVDFMLRQNTLIGAAYRWQQDFGRTPFAFDHRDITHELRLRYGFLGAHWAYDLGVNYDLERLRAYDTTVGIRRRFDCMEVGFAYSARNQGFNLILNLLPGALRAAPAGKAARP